MAVMAGVLSETQRRTLTAVCDTFVPSVETDEADPVLRAFLARAASDLAVADQVEGLMAEGMTETQIAGVAQMLDGLAEHDFAALPLGHRTQALLDTQASSAEAKLGIKTLRQLTLLFFYAAPDPATGTNANWAAIGYPGPPEAPPAPEAAPKTIPVEPVEGPHATLTADAVVIGSGAGGGVIAARLAGAGRSVVVLEMGRYHNEADFAGLELPGMLDLYLGGGLYASEDGGLAVLAGSCLGGGTTVNYMNCLHTPDRIRREWAAHGLEGLDTPDYDRQMARVFDRLGASTATTRHNTTHRKLIEAFDAEGIDHGPIKRNGARGCEDPSVCGYCYVGCPRGSKQGTMKTYLQDAADAGARFVVGAHADRVLVEDGRAVGVEATVLAADGSTTVLRVEAPTVVCAAGSIENPAVLLRSGIGGPAVGRHLRVHPASIVRGIYEEPIEGWSGQIQSEVSHHFDQAEDGYGFLIEATYMAPGLFLSGVPWADGEDHKRAAARTFRHTAPFISVNRDHGSGEVVIDEKGRSVVRWSLGGDETDLKLFVQAQVELCRLHRAAGAKEIATFHSLALNWREGEDFDLFCEQVRDALYEANDIAIFSAHQMGSCRMGSDPSDSVADGRGQLHDVEGVWIGDSSAFPTAPGVNPMVTIMSLAHRTADAIVRGN